MLISIDFRKLGESVESYILDVMNEKTHTKMGLFMRGFLFVCSRFYRNAVQFRNWLYDKGIFRRSALGCLVVSVGNLTCGGTGKTPVTEIFARTLTDKGRKVAILSRGYKSKESSSTKKIFSLFHPKEENQPPRIVSDGKNLLLSSDVAGDEPYMLATNLKDVVVLVDRDRVKSGRYAIKQFEVDTLILDDGFQYLDLKPHINIVLVDSTAPFHNHHVLPRGLLREPIKNIRKANYVFLTKSNGGNHIRHLKKFIEHHNRRAEIIECTHKPKYLENAFKKGDIQPLSFLNGKKISALSGIAKPESFEVFLKNLGAELVYTKRFTDHHNYSQQEIINFINKSKRNNAEIAITTEKDSVRLPRLARQDIDFYHLRIEIDILSGFESFEQCISRICFK